MRVQLLPVRVLPAVVGILFLLLGLVSSVQAGDFQSDQSVIQVVSTSVQGKNVYIPSTIVVVSDRKHTLSLFNTTDVPHGFRIDGLDLETVLEPQQETELELPPLEDHRIYEIRCQLHPAHRTGTLVVMPGNDKE